MKPYTYRGWEISYDAGRPFTGRWRADRYGVGMCNNSEYSIMRMVDRKVFEAEEERRLRAAET